MATKIFGIGQRLREERERTARGQHDFAALLGVTRNTQSNYEREERYPDASYLAAAAEAGVDVLYVVTGVRVQAAGLSPRQSKLLECFGAASCDAQEAALLVLAALACFEPAQRPN